MAHAPVISSTDFRSVLGHFPTGVVVVTGMADGLPRGFTVQSFMALSLEPPLILLSIDRNSTSWPKIAAGTKFAVNVMAGHQQELALSFAKSGGPKFDGVEWYPGPMTAAPLLTGCQAWVECEIWQRYDGGDHEIIAARVLGLRAGDDPSSHPLLFLRSKFPQLDRAHWDSIAG
ncbi:MULTISPECIES: flavin reductase family protein [Mycolicibacterium]|uniref:flavin reductase family protein n=1 Tax=Mycolicibacterium TaxID=1866885 RepID=UPI000A8DB332|nr:MULTISPECIES: flavin reductase family protein [Mycolicibacterium]MCW1824423.1 flavin reductase family protein [Mycolicibacterium senegalense]